MGLLRFYRPWLVKLTIAYSLVVLTLYAFGVYCHGHFLAVSLCTAVLGYLYMFAPAVFGLVANRQIQIAFPASWQEKSILYLGFSIIFIPLLVYGLYCLLCWAGGMIWPYGNLQQTLVQQVGQEVGDPMVGSLMTPKSQWLSWACSGFVALSTLTGVIVSKRHRFFMGIIGGVVGNTVSGILSIVITLRALFGSLETLNDESTAPAEIIAAVANDMNVYNSIMIYLAVALGAFVVWKIKNAKV